MAIKINRWNLQIEFTEPVLGTVQLNPEIWAEYGGGGQPGAGDDEAGTLANAVAQETGKGEEPAKLVGKTGFHMDAAGMPMIYDFHVKGYLKEAARSLRRATGSRISKMTAYRQKLTTLLFIEQRQIKLRLPPDGEIEEFTHIVRGDTPKGPRVAPTTSRRCQAGTWFACTVKVLGEAIKEDDLRELLDFGELHGMGKWRSGGWGRFTYSLDGTEGSTFGQEGRPRA